MSSNSDITLLIALLLGAGMSAMFGLGWNAWREADRLGKRPSQVKKENKERNQKAKEEAAKGRSRRLNALLLWAGGLILVVLAFLLLTNFFGP